jgi:Glycosyl transferase family 2
VNTTATVLIPTTGDRGPLLRYSVGSVLAQTVRDLEIFIVGDGVTDSSREIVADLMKSDKRVRFFDFPKHERRGEPYRHEVLAGARGEIVCYLCDRDLMLPHHVATVAGLLRTSDFAHTLWAHVLTDGRFALREKLQLTRPGHRRAFIAGRVGIGLSQVGHTMTMYQRLPQGWSTTPREVATDWYMWQKFLSHPQCQPAGSDSLTILYFQRNGPPPWPVDKRVPELNDWSQRMQDPAWCERIVGEMSVRLSRRRPGLHRRIAMFWRLHPRFATIPGLGRIRTRIDRILSVP